MLYRTIRAVTIANGSCTLRASQHSGDVLFALTRRGSTRGELRLPIRAWARRRRPSCLPARRSRRPWCCPRGALRRAYPRVRTWPRPAPAPALRSAARLLDVVPAPSSELYLWGVTLCASGAVEARPSWASSRTALRLSRGSGSTSSSRIRRQGATHWSWCV
jgi:hypothetical protein